MNYARYRYDADPYDADPDESACRHCRGRGYIPHRGEAMAADPCGWCDPVEEDEPEDEEEDA